MQVNTGGRWFALAACCLLAAGAGCEKDKKKTTPEARRRGGGDDPAARPGEGPSARPGSRESGDGPVISSSRRPGERPGPGADPGGITPPTAPRRPTLGKERKIVLLPIATIKRLIVAKQYQRAIAEAKKHLEVNEKSVPAMAIMAESYFRKGDDELCKAVLASINNLQKDHPLFLYLWGHLYLRDGSFALAVKYFERAVQQNPQLLDAWTMIGVRYLQGGSYQQALSALLKAKALSGGNTYAMNLNIGSAYRGLAHHGSNPSYYVTALNYYAEAEKLYKQSHANQTYLAALYNKAILYLDAKQFPGYSKVKRLETGLSYLQMYVVLAPQKTPDVWAKEKKQVMALLKKIKNADLPAAKAMAQAAASQPRTAPTPPRPTPRRRTPPGPPPR